MNRSKSLQRNRSPQRSPQRSRSLTRLRLPDYEFPMEDKEDAFFSPDYNSPNYYRMGDVYYEMEEHCIIDKNEYAVFIHNGIPYYYKTRLPITHGLPVDSKHRKGIFVLDRKNLLHMRVPRIGHHSDLAVGEPVKCAGEFALSEKGKIRQLSNKSGHYLPGYECLQMVVDIIEESGYYKPIKLFNTNRVKSARRATI
jgi:hypothetical protein